MPAQVLRNDGPVDGVAQGNAARRRGSGNRDLLLNHPHRLPFAPVFVLLGIGRIQLLDIEVALVNADNREAEADILVVPERDAGQSGLAGADRVQPGPTRWTVLRSDGTRIGR